MPVYHKKVNNESGFTLIELTVVLLIVGIVIGTFTSGFMVYLDQTRMKQSNERLEKIREAINIYLDLNGKLPCPASLTASIDDNRYGREASTTNCLGVPTGNGVFANTSVGITGAVPTRSLNLPDAFMTDGWNNRYFYAVSSWLATPGQYTGTGNIAIHDSNGNLITGAAHFVIVSAGENGVGAYDRNGNQVLDCSGPGLDRENCNMNNTFRSTLLFSDAGTNAHFDDLIYYQSQTQPNEAIPSGAVLPFDGLSSCPSGWTSYTRATGRSIIGSGNYSRSYTNGSLNWTANITYMPGTQGGFSSWRQSENQVGAHLHKLGVTSERIIVNPGGTVSGNIVQRHILSDSAPTSNFETSVDGLAQPMNNMPPYVALLYCRKD